MSEKSGSSVNLNEVTKPTKDGIALQEFVDSTFTGRGDPRLRLDTGKEHLTFRRKWWQLWYVSDVYMRTRPFTG